MPRLRLLFFGEPLIELEGAPVHIERRKAMALLAYLAATDKGHSREILSTLLWPESGRQTARTALRRDFSLLRKRLGTEWFAADRDRVDLNRVDLNQDAVIWTDVVQFQRLLFSSRGCKDVGQERALLQEAVLLYRSDFLTGFNLPDSPNFDEWLTAYTESLRRDLTGALERLVQIGIEQGAYDSVLEYARRWLDLDPLQEGAHRDLMQLYALSGRRTDALRQYDECVRILSNELGVEPEAETQALYQSIREGQFPFAAKEQGFSNSEVDLHSLSSEEFDQSASQSKNVVEYTPRIDWGEAPHSDNLHGRDAEVTDLTRWLIEDRCRLILLLGMGGMGKTVLATHLADRLKEQFDYIIWRSLRNAPPFEELLADWVLVLSDQQTYDIPDAVDKQISLLIESLFQKRCLLVLDNVEAIMQPGEWAGYFRQGYEAYGQFLQRIGEGRHGSTLLLTSREAPAILSLLEGETSPVRILHLHGLSPDACQSMLYEKGLVGSEGVWATLRERYSGNPLALKLVGQTIRDLFDGEIAEFLADETLIFGGIHRLLFEQFEERLTALEQAIMTWLAIERAPIDTNELRQRFVQKPVRRQLLEALRNLHQRSLLERHADGYSQQNVVMEYVTERLVERVYQDIKQLDLAPERDLNQHALMLAQTKEYIRLSQIRLMLKPVAEQLLAQLGQAGARARFKQILAALCALRYPGYAAGTILNLLLYMGIDAREFDFSGIAVWQAYLQGVFLQGVNFARSDLSGSVFAGAYNVVLSVTYSPSGKLVAVGTVDGSVRILRADDGQLHHLCVGHSGWVWSVTFSPDERLLASGSTDQTIRIWDVQTGHLRNVLKGHTGSVNSVCFSAQGDALASASDDHGVYLWDTPSSQGKMVDGPRRMLQGHAAPVYGLCFGADDHTLVSAGDDHAIHIWDTQSGVRLNTLAGHTNRIWCLRLSPDGRTLASGSKDQTIRLWDMKGVLPPKADGAKRTDPCRAVLRGHTGWVMGVDFGPDGKTLVSSSEDHTARIWDVQSGQLIRTLLGHSARVISTSCSPDGKTIVTGGDDLSVRLWDVQTGRVLRILQGHSNRIVSIDFSPNGRLLASGGEDQILRFWDVQTGQIIGSLQGHTSWVQFVCFSPSGNLIATDSRDRTVRLWNVQSQQCLHTLPIHASDGDSISFNSTEETLASADEGGMVRLWDLSTGQCFAQWSGHTDGVLTVCYSPDDSILASGSRDRTVRLWDARTGAERMTLQGHLDGVRSVAFSPDGTRLVSGSDDQTVRLWDSHTGQEIAVLQGHAGWVWSVCFSPDGKFIASGSKDRTIRLWDASTGEFLHSWRNQTGDVNCVRFNAESRLLASCSYNDINLWDMQTRTCINTLRPDRPYERMNITDVSGVTDAQRAGLTALGAITQAETTFPHRALDR